jgi:uncharacterized protein YeaO (DUF488 family)
MPVRIIRLGTPRSPAEGPRLGTVRRPPRGVKKADYGRLDYFDIWLPELAPSAKLVSYAYAQEFTPQRWAAYARRYRTEMRAPAAQRLIAVLAALSTEANFAVGCYCEDETRCHRSLLRELLAEAKATIAE